MAKANAEKVDRNTDKETSWELHGSIKKKML